MNVFITSDEIASIINLQGRYDTAAEQVYCYSDQRMCSVLETDMDMHVFRAGGDECLRRTH